MVLKTSNASTACHTFRKRIPQRESFWIEGLLICSSSCMWYADSVSVNTPVPVRDLSLNYWRFRIICELVDNLGDPNLLLIFSL